MSKGNGHGPDPCKDGHDKMYFRDEERGGIVVLRHWICRRCHTPGADPA